MYQFTLTIGDVCHDGHGHTQTYIFKSNKPPEDVAEATKWIPVEFGILLQEWCIKDNILWDHELILLANANITVDDLREYGEYSEGPLYRSFTLDDPKGMAYIWMRLLEEVYEDLLLEFDDGVPNINAMIPHENHTTQVYGYGLFHA